MNECQVVNSGERKRIGQGMQSCGIGVIGSTTVRTNFTGDTYCCLFPSETRRVRARSHARDGYARRCSAWVHITHAWPWPTCLSVCPRNPSVGLHGHPNTDRPPLLLHVQLFVSLFRIASLQRTIQVLRTPSIAQRPVHGASVLYYT
jgi:hypothetical protein